jgi:hypothetical protein
VTTRTEQLHLEGFGAAPAEARAEVAVLTPSERLKRAAIVFGAFIAVALIALPIPLVHFVVVPTGLLLAFVLGLYRLPRTVDCAHCHRRPTLEGGQQ